MHAFYAVVSFLPFTTFAIPLSDVNLIANAAIQAGELPASNIGDGTEFPIIAANPNEAFQIQGCNIFKCGGTVIPKAICIGNQIAKGGTPVQIWTRIQTCGINAAQVRPS
jgi:hypothetical protein